MKGVPDYYAVLGLERKAVMDPDAVTEAFHALSRSEHPDVAGAGGEFEAVGEAYRRLRDPGSRLKHLMELEFPEREKAGGRAMISGNLLELFGLVGEALQGADDVLKKRSESRTALGRAVLAPEEMARQGALQEIGARVHAEIEKVEARFEEVDALLVSDRESAATLGGDLVQRIGFLAKWRTQIREKVAAFL